MDKKISQLPEAVSITEAYILIVQDEEDKKAPSELFIGTLTEVVTDGVTIGGSGVLGDPIKVIDGVFQTIDNKTIDGTLSGNSDTLYPSEKAVKTYADTKQTSLGFTPENVANKDTDSSFAANSDTKYPSQKAVKTALDLKAPLASPTLTGNPTAPTQSALDGSTKIATTKYVDDAIAIISSINSVIVNIGDWNMHQSSGGSSSVNIAHGLILSKIRSVSGLIRNDADNAYTPITWIHPNSHPGGFPDALTVFSVDGTNVTLAATTGGTFDGTNYDSTSFNRGWIVITYVP